MGKLRTKKRFSGARRQIGMKATMARDGGGFLACIRVSDKSGRVSGKRGVACGFDNNPRKALAKAARKLATKISARSGAFAGLK